MTTPYSADDLIKRSILGSIIGFGLKKAKGNEVNSAISVQYPCQQSSSSSSNARNNDNVNVAIKESNEADASQEIEKSTKCVKHIHDADNNFLHYRSQQDIYHEIVCECAQLENNFSNCSSSRSSTQSPPLSAAAAAAATLLNDSTQTTTKINSVINRNVFLCETEQQSTSNTPTALSINSSETNSDSTSENNNNNNISIEDFVKLVVTAVKKAGFFPNQKNNDLTETPEEILRRKRAQNNEAAARYRKRRKELKVEAKEELKVLIVKNKQLKQQVECLQAEITHLKTAVLTTSSSSSSSSLNPNSQFSSQITEPSQ